MRILFCTSLTYLPQRVGGLQSAIHELAKHLIAAGDDVAVLASVDTSDRLGKLNRLRRHLLRWHKYPADSYTGYPVYRGWDVVSGLAEVVKRFRPDVIVVTVGEPVPLAHEAEKLDLPTFIHLHDVEFENLGGDPRALHKTRFIANSSFTARRFEETYGIRAQVSLNLIDSELYRVEPTAEKVVFINPHPWKGVDIALAAAVANPDVQFIFVESWKLSDTEHTRVQTAIEKLPNVTWFPRTLDMRQVYRQAAFLIAPSQWEEAWGRIVSEAQVSGIPVIVSDRGGLPEATGPGGIVLPALDVDAWSKTVRELWHNQTLRSELGALALTHAGREEIQSENVCSAYRALLDDAKMKHHEIGVKRIEPISRK